MKYLSRLFFSAVIFGSGRNPGFARCCVGMVVLQAVFWISHCPAMRFLSPVVQAGPVVVSRLQESAESEIDFNRSILPILAASCFSCHGPDQGGRQADLRLDTFAGATQSAIQPGDAAASDLVDRITSDDPDLRMPPPESGHAGLSQDQVRLIRAWIDQGAQYQSHWALVPPELPQVPQVKPDSARSDLRSPIDAFVWQKLQEKSLSRSPRADKPTLARRAALDITGLPPSPKMLQDFLADDRADAYSRYVRQLLDEPSYGEHWATMWLDLARYADTDGYADDVPRTIWPYRDWVIQAFNRDLPYDQFTIEQIAGDLLPNPTTDQLIATGFNRNTMTNSEGGTIDEEYRVEAVKDRVDTTMQVWSGMTFACAKCHTHKYDPITQEEYYQLFDVFNQSVDADQPGNPPSIPVQSYAEAELAAELRREIQSLEDFDVLQHPEFQNAFAGWVNAWQASEMAWRSLEIVQAESISGTKLVTAGELESSPLMDSPSRELSLPEAALAKDPARVFAVDKNPETDTYRLQSVAPKHDVSAIRVHVVPSTDPQQTTAGVGRSTGNGNFVISEAAIRVRLLDPNHRVGRFVRLELPGAEKMIHIAELQVMTQSQATRGDGSSAEIAEQADAAGLNLSRAATATQSSTGFGGVAGRAIDGNTDGRFEQGSVTHTMIENDPWFELDLGVAQSIDQIKIHSRTDGDLFRRLDGLLVKVLDDHRNVIWQTTVQQFSTEPMVLELADWTQWPIAIATSDYAQTDADPWDAAKLIDGDQGAKGWAVGGDQQRAHQAVLQLERPLRFGNLVSPDTPSEADPSAGDAGQVQPSEIEISLVQNYGQQHTLANVLIQTTDRQGPHVAVPVEIARQRPVNDEATARWLEQHPQLREQALEHFAASHVMVAPLVQQRKELQTRLESLPGTSTPIMQELLPAQRRETRLLIKGSWLSPGQVVHAALPGALGGTHPSSVDRLVLAKWLVDSKHPTSSRVAVNRIWARLLGRGLVETEEDFGLMGDLPTHPQLLDWLAVKFSGDWAWSQKELIYQIVCSETYCQSSTVSVAGQRQDPENRWLSRAPRFRLSAEQVRDQALAISGLLNPQMYGPGVVPRLPVKEIGSAFSNRTITQSAGPDLYRRGVYTYVRRTGPYPTVLTFDGGNRQVCSVRRIRTNTPLQALVTLNDPVFVEAAQALARNILQDASVAVAGGAGAVASESLGQSDGAFVSEDSDRTRLEVLFRQVTARDPKPSELKTLLELLAEQRDHFQSQAAEAKMMATDPLGPLPGGLSEMEAASWTVLANVLLNLDEIMVR